MSSIQHVQGDCLCVPRPLFAFRFLPSPLLLHGQKQTLRGAIASCVPVVAPSTRSKGKHKAESSGVLKTVDEDRKCVIQASIQATIVRIMKVRKTMKNQPLVVSEVISQISQRFTPKIPDIKKGCLLPCC
ncbi:hypothetical protein DFH94DRAFT_224026 [Russula ochroleuca]|uniref:Cullin neddylation domain-containing protein n=1 Tax=Russula ochroleuca TaxID=152965 RepID=A0A9P5MQX6_9AGAM|nr:hypothetical protein DFH94DRAFT_224026 [Russula ochroleuca]